MRLSAALAIALSGSLAACAGRDSAAPTSPAAEAPAAGAASPEAAAAARESMSRPERKAAEPSPTATPTLEEEAADPVVALAEAEGALERALVGAGRVEQEPGRTKKEEPLAEGGDRCAVACRALASMRRSAERLCGLATGAPAEAMRCDDARTRVTRAESRVKQRCPACPAAG